MKKGNSNSILKKPKLHFLEESGKTYLVISLKKYSQKHRRSYSCLPSK